MSPSATNSAHAQSSLERIAVRVRTARRWIHAARAVEALLLGLSVWVLLCAAALRMDVLDRAARLAAGVAALALVLSYLRHARASAAAVAQHMDRQLTLDGAFLTAWECSQRPSSDALAELLGIDLCRRVNAAQCRRASVPNSLPYLALPLLTLACFAWVREHKRETDVSAWRTRLAASLLAELQQALPLATELERAGELQMEQRVQLERLKAEVRQWQSDVQREDMRAQELAARAAEMEAQLREIGRELQPATDLAQRLERAAETLAAAQLAEQAEIGGAAADAAAGESAIAGRQAMAPAGSAEGRALAPDPGSAQMDSSARQKSAAGASVLENGAARDTIGASLDPEPVSPAAPTRPWSAAPAPMQGVVGGHLWPAHQAPILEKWVEHERQRPEHGPLPVEPANEHE